MHGQVSNIDFAPTLRRRRRRRRPGRTMDGVSLLPTIRNPRSGRAGRSRSRRSRRCSKATSRSTPGTARTRGVRTDRYTYVVYKETGDRSSTTAARTRTSSTTSPPTRPTRGQGAAGGAAGQARATARGRRATLRPEPRRHLAAVVAAVAVPRSPPARRRRPARLGRPPRRALLRDPRAEGRAARRAGHGLEHDRLHDCPAAWWNAFDAGGARRRARRRRWSSSTARATGSWTRRQGRPAESRCSHGLRFRQVATIPIRTSRRARADALHRAHDRAPQHLDAGTTGARSTSCIAPGGDIYVMQAYSQINDPTLSDRRPARGWARGWSSRPGGATARASSARTSSLRARRQRHDRPGRAAEHVPAREAATPPGGKRKRHEVSLEGKTKNVPAPPGTIEDRGTISGTPFGKGRMSLKVALANGRVTGTFRLLPKGGSINGTSDMAFTIADGEIDFNGTAHFTAGTGAYRGITSWRAPGRRRQHARRAERRVRSTGSRPTKSGRRQRRRGHARGGAGLAQAPVHRGGARPRPRASGRDRCACPRG